VSTTSRRSAAGRDRPHPGARGAAPPSAERLPLVALGLLAIALYGPALAVGFVGKDLVALDTVLQTGLGALLRGGALPGDYAPLSRELWWWWWWRTLALDATALHVLNAALAVACGWMLYRAVEARAGVGAARWAALAWAVFPPLGSMLGAVSGARELMAAFWVAASVLLFERGRWIATGLTTALAGLSGGETLGLPVALAVLDVIERRDERTPQRVPRLLPALLGSVLAAVVLVRSRPVVLHPAPDRVRIVASFVQSWLPASTRAGLGAAWHLVPWLVLLAGGLAALAASRPSDRRGAETARLWLPAGLAFALVPLVPLAIQPSPPPAERFAAAAVGVALMAASLGTVNSWIGRAAISLAAIVGLGANALSAGPIAPPSRFTALATLRDQSRAIAPLLSALHPVCADLGSVPRSFVAGGSPDSLFRLALGPGARATCRRPHLDVRFLAELTPQEAGAPFGVLHFDPQRVRFDFERADARVRALVGEGLLVYARHAPAAACFEAAAAERPQDRELVYPLVSALAAAQRGEEARARWSRALREGLAPSADTLAARFLFGETSADADSARRAAARLAHAVLDDPTVAAPHLALGRFLLDRGRGRAATIEISVACGIGRRSQDVFWLARGYDAIGAQAEALEAYRAALAGGLDSTTYAQARGRLAELLRAIGPAALDAGGPR
jgi:hypothetical protein